MNKSVHWSRRAPPAFDAPAPPRHPAVLFYDGIAHPAKPSARDQESAALVEHWLFDYLISFQQPRGSDGVAEHEGHRR